MCVAEMATHLPVRGSIYEFATRFVDPAFGFALGWTYFYASSMLYCAEISAVATVSGIWWREALESGGALRCAASFRRFEVAAGG